MEITYRLLRSDLWRGAIYTSLRSPQLLKFVPYWVGLILFNATLFLLRGDYLGAVSSTVITCLISASSGLAVGFLFLTYSVYKRMPSASTERLCTERISPQGFECLVPERHHQIAWQDVLRITETAQDIYLFAGKGQGFYIPKRVFDGPEQARAFLQTARTYWDSAKRGLPMPAQEGVWPPAPLNTEGQEPGGAGGR